MSGRAGDPAVSVLIPAHCAESYLEEAVYSALIQPETLEVVIVEDGSPDGTFGLCQRLASEDERVRIYQHSQGRNRGEAASRNLLVSRVVGEFVAFLDADDYFLPDRFKTALPMLQSDAGLDGVYEAVVTRVEVGEDDELFPDGALTTIGRDVPAEELLAVLIQGSCGYFCMGGIVLRAEALRRVGPFDESLRLSPDTPMWWRLAASCRLAAGSIDHPVAVRRRHGGNLYASKNPDIADIRLSCALSAYRWARKNRVDADKLRLFRRGVSEGILDSRQLSGMSLRLRQLRRWMRVVLQYPGMATDARVWSRLWESMRRALTGSEKAG